MNCEKCGDNIVGSDVYEFMDRKVCDDCYIDLMLGVPEVDFSALSEDIQSRCLRYKKGWHRDRPNRHHYLNFSNSDK